MTYAIKTYFITVLGWTKTKLLTKLPNEAWIPDSQISRDHPIFR